MLKSSRWPRSHHPAQMWGDSSPTPGHTLLLCWPAQQTKRPHNPAFSCAGAKAGSSSCELRRPEASCSRHLWARYLQAGGHSLPRGWQELGSNGREHSFLLTSRVGRPLLPCEISEIIVMQTLRKATRLLSALSPAAPAAPMSAHPPFFLTLQLNRG